MEKIDLGKILQKDEKKLPRSRDGVLVLELIKTEKYSIAYGELLPKEKNKIHRLAQEETYYFLEGEGKLTIDGKIATVKKDVIITIPPGCKQRLENTTNKSLKFLMVVSPPYNPEKEEILE